MRLSRCLCQMLHGVRVLLCPQVHSTKVMRQLVSFSKLLTRLCSPVPFASVCGRYMCRAETATCAETSAAVSQARSRQKECGTAAFCATKFAGALPCFAPFLLSVLLRSWGAGCGRAGGSTAACRAAGRARTHGCSAQRGGRSARRRACACEARRPCLAGAAAAGQATRCEPCSCHVAPRIGRCVALWHLATCQLHSCPLQTLQ